MPHLIIGTKMKARVTRWLGYLAFLLVIIPVVILSHLAVRYYRVPLSTFAWFIVGVPVGIIVHEAGHAVCCLLVRIPIHRVVVGTGPVILGRHVGGTQLELRLLPLSGVVHFDSPFPRRKLATAFVTAGGVLGNIALIGGVTALATTGAVPNRAPTSLAAMAAAQFLLVALSLVPFRARIGQVRIATDGLKLLSLMLWPLTGERQLLRSYAAQIARYRGQPSERWRPSQASLRIAVQMSRAGWWNEARRRDIQHALMAELEGGGLAPEEEMLVLDKMLTYALVPGDVEFRCKLDAWSRRALELGPGLQTLLATRGAVLVELGEYEAGKALLLPVLAQQGNAADALFDKLLCQYFMARAEHALGNVAESRAFEEAARKTAASISETAPVQVLLRRLEAEKR